MSEYIISYRAGDSPYWYNMSLYASDPAGAMADFCRYYCPYNWREIKIEEV